MKTLTAEWVEKAEGDFHSCLREVRARRHPNPDSACFHAQQCVEKYLKARLQEAGLTFPKTHDLLDLLKRLLPVEPAWATLNPRLTQLVNYAVVFCRGRFPLSGDLRQQGRCAEGPGRLPRGAPSRPSKLEAEGLRQRLHCRDGNRSATAVGRVTPCAPSRSVTTRRARSDAPYPPPLRHYPGRRVSVETGRQRNEDWHWCRCIDGVNSPGANSPACSRRRGR
jgi:hypothetical protein